MLNDAGIPIGETERIQIFFLICAILTPIIFLSIKKYFPDFVATKRKLIIMGLTTVIISIQLLLGAIMLKHSVDGFEVNLRLSVSLKSLCFVIISALSVGPYMIHGMYSDAVSSQCSVRVNPYSLSNMGCALIRFFTLLPIIIVCALFSKPEEYVPCFAALLPLLSINLMAYALEQPPRIHLVENNEGNVEEAESQC
ncbi:hypothetical protein CAEBREN_04545 [Caenorhabditis brenneri]|uniref:Uncharacterized protein n=1 Tax=Caenorhabditis brenneri TaxID=135651 RepID=G0NZ65_CAEBE|nr:hypothetical protein CAEBREN_04545 [Caenorhabditis brenneri]